MVENEQDGLPLEGQSVEKQAGGDPAKEPAKKPARGRAKAKEEPAPEVTEAEVAAAQELVTNWEFINRIPSPDEVRKLLETLPAWWGVKPVDYLDYVQALPSDKKIKITVATQSGGTRKEDRWFQVVTLYFSVAGRQQMLRDAQERHGWRVDNVPEPNVGSNPHGFVTLNEDRIVYREYVEILAPTQPGTEDGRVVWRDGQKFELLGRKPGMAWVPYSGGQQAKGSNPYEKVETAARGRALAAWGFGVLPGSGVASYEEMMGVSENRRAAAGETGGQSNDGGDGGRRETPQELIAQILTMAEEIRQLRGDPEGWNLRMLADYAVKVQNVDIVTVMEPDNLPGEIDLTKVNAGGLLVMRNGLRKRLATARDDQESGA